MEVMQEIIPTGAGLLPIELSFVQPGKRNKGLEIRSPTKVGAIRIENRILRGVLVNLIVRTA
jgi:hypothetical protein